MGLAVPYYKRKNAVPSMGVRFLWVLWYMCNTLPYCWVSNCCLPYCWVSNCCLPYCCLPYCCLPYCCLPYPPAPVYRST